MFASRDIGPPEALLGELDVCTDSFVPVLFGILVSGVSLSFLGSLPHVSPLICVPGIQAGGFAGFLPLGFSGDIGYGCSAEELSLGLSGVDLGYSSSLVGTIRI